MKNQNLSEKLLDIMENIIHLFKRIISDAHISINKMSTNFYHSKYNT